MHPPTIAACGLSLSCLLAVAPGAGDGPAAPEGGQAEKISRPAATEVEKASSLLRLYASEFPFRPLTTFGAQFAFSGQPASEMTPEGYPEGIQVIQDTTWDFSGDSSAETAISTRIPPGPGSSCYASFCGFDAAGVDAYERVHSASDLAVRSLAALDWDGAGTFYLRAALYGDLGAGNLRFCFDPASGHSEYPYMVFGHPDGADYYMEPGDSWSTPVWNCEQSLWILGSACKPGNPTDLLPRLPGLEGRATFQVRDSGVLVLPSGHHLNAMLIESRISSAVRDETCVFDVAEARLRQYTWFVPKLGVAATIGTAYNDADPDYWTSSLYSTYGFGLYPPLDIWVEATGDGWFRVAWDPGRHTEFIDGYKVYWDVDSGRDSPYARNSDTDAQLVQVSGTTATVQGVTDCGARYVTVTARYTHTDPYTGEATQYESLLFPDQVFGDPDYAYPIEVAGHSSGGLVVGITTTPDPPELCGAGTVSAEATPGFASYLWQDGQTIPTPSFDVDADEVLRVEASDARGCTAISSVPVRVDYPPEFATASSADPDPCTLGILVSWEPALFRNAGGTGFYNVYRSEVSCGDALAAGPIATSLGGTSYTDSATVADHSYFYVVEAEDGRPDSPCDGGPVGSGAATRVCIQPAVTDVEDTTGPDRDVGNTLRAWKDTPDSVRFTWADVPLEAGEKFWVGRATDPRGPFRNIGRGPMTTPEFTDTRARPERLYFYDVRIEDACGNLSAD